MGYYNDMIDLSINHYLVIIISESISGQYVANLISIGALASRYWVTDNLY